MTNSPFIYTDRDYVSIRNQLVDFLKNKVPEWTADPSDFALSILEGMAYLGDMMSFYVDRAAQESNILTANRAANIYSLARMFGYIPGLATSAQATVKFTNPTDEEITVQRGVQVGAISGGSAYELQGDIDVPPRTDGVDGTAIATVLEGSTRSLRLGTSDGTGNQRFLLPDKNVDGREGSFTVQTQNPEDPSIVEFWTATELVLDSPSGDYVFAATTYPDGSTYISFGDGVAGRVPPKGWIIFIYYRVTSGAAGNSTAPLSRFLVSWDDPSMSKYAEITVSTYVENDKTFHPTGGTDRESLDSIRAGTVNLTKTQRRAVTALDYESLIKTDSRILDAACESMVWSRPTIWILPREFSLLSNQEGLASLIQQTEDKALQAAMAGVTPDARAGTPIAFGVSIEVIASASVDVNYVHDQVQQTVYDAFSYETGILGAPVTADHIIRAISDGIPISVVQFARVRKLTEGTVTLPELLPRVNELVYLENTDAVVVTVSKTVSTGRART